VSDLRETDDRELSELYRRGRSEQPPPALDAVILAQAKRQNANRKRRLLVPLASAALLLVGLSLTLRVIELDRPLEKAPEEAEAPLPRRQSQDQAPAPAVAPAIPPPAPTPRSRPPVPTARALKAPAKAEQDRFPAPAALDDMEQGPAPMGYMMAPMREKSAEGPDPFLAIRELLRQGRREEARQALLALLRERPGLTVPPELRDLLTNP
jgi:hypothetical protein